MTRTRYFGYANFFESMRGFVAEVGQARAAPGWAELHQELAASLPKLAAPPPAAGLLLPLCSARTWRVCDHSRRYGIFDAFRKCRKRR